MEEIRLPREPYRIDEINIPANLAKELAGKIVEVKVIPEELPGTRKLEIGDYPALIARDGTIWNDFRPKQISYQDTRGRNWNLPRCWNEAPDGDAEPVVEGESQVFRECQFIEALHLPSTWDLRDINIPSENAEAAAGHETRVVVHLIPEDVVRAYWRDSSGTVWRIPHDWRRRRVRLPSFEKLASREIPEEVLAHIVEPQ